MAKQKSAKQKSKKPVAAPLPELPPEFGVAGADLSLRRPGLAFLQVKEGRIIQAEAFSLDNKKSPKNHGELLLDIESFLEGHLRQAKPLLFVREKAINARSSMSEIGLFKVVGIADLVLTKYKPDATWEEIYPVSVKKILTGTAKSDKEAVSKAVQLYLPPITFADDDQSDACAVAVAYLLRNNVLTPINPTPEEETR